MSLILAIKEQDREVIAADTQTTRGDLKYTKLSDNNRKFWRALNSDVIIGHSGPVRDANVIRIMPNLINDEDENNELTFELMVRRVVPLMREELIRYGFMKDEKPYENFESRFIFASKDKCFTVDHDGCIEDVENFTAIGSGSMEAMEVLSANDKVGITVEERAYEAIKASAKNNLYVGLPAMITDTKDGQIKIIE